MGQILVVNVLEEGERICNIYFHWSAYSDSALYELLKIKKIICGEKFETSVYDCQTKKIKKMTFDFSPKNNGVVLQIINCLAMFGGGLDPDDVETAKKWWPGIDVPVTKSRSEGIVSITEKTMNESDGYAEGFATIDISGKTACNECFFCYDSKEEYEEYAEEEANVVHTDIDFSKIPFDTIEDAIKFVDNVPFNSVIESGGVYLSLIA